MLRESSYRLLIIMIMLITSVFVTVLKVWGRLNVNCNKILTILKTVQHAMALNFPNHSLYISVSCASNTMVLFYIYGSTIPVVGKSKFLGIIFDRKFSFIPHIKYLKAKCLLALNILKILSYTSWGANRITLLTLYRV